MLTVDTAKPGEEYYNSLFQQFADWGLDFVKVDDLSRPYHSGEIEAIRLADRSDGPADRFQHFAWSDAAEPGRSHRRPR